MNVIWYGWMVECSPKGCPWNGISTRLLLESTALSNLQCLSSALLTFVRAESCQEQKYKQLLAVVLMLVISMWTSRMKQWEELQDPSKFHLVREHDLFQILKKVNKWLSNFPQFHLSLRPQPRVRKWKPQGFCLSVLLVCKPSTCPKNPYGRRKLLLSQCYLQCTSRCHESIGTVSGRHGCCALCLRTKSSVLHQWVITGWISYNAGDRLILHACHHEPLLHYITYSKPMVSV